MKDTFTKQWITGNSIRIVQRYKKGVLTLRGLHYQLVGAGMTNTIQHYKRVVNAMIDARWEGSISFDTFSDLDRAMVSETLWKETSVKERFDYTTLIESVRFSIIYWMENYRKNRWENQPFYPEIFIEKKALQGVFQPVCERWNVTLGACKGYPSLTFLYESSIRFQNAESAGKKPIIIYFGDYDPSGEDIPRSIGENLSRFGVDVEVRRIALMEEQVIAWKLPPAPTKDTDSRSAAWDGLGQVELDAVTPEMLDELCEDAIRDIFDEDLWEELKTNEAKEKIKYKKGIKNFIKSIK